ncbi:MAG: helix-turn-helix transcriptional regulator [Candidatus Izemoplasmatales bacterium]|nr:helix-turn-helix transcriptional regulator [Candidatus Izemoplasmatales bacterium]
MKYDITIKKLREAMFLSQEELAKILGVSIVTVNRWENGKFEPTIKVKRKLNELFLEYRIFDDKK